MLQKSKVFCQLHYNQIEDHVILSLVIDRWSFIYSDAFVSKYASSLERSMVHTLAYFRIQISKREFLNHAFKLGEGL